MTGVPEPAAGEPAATPAALVVLIMVPVSLAPVLARTLVEDGRAACVNCLPGVRSTYRSTGRVEQAEDAVRIAKPTAAGYPALEQRRRELRPQAVAQVLTLPVAAGFGPYLEWLNRSVTAS